MGNYIAFSDFHLHNFEAFARPVTYNFYGKEIQVTDRLVAQIKTIDKIFELAKERKADILFAGDFFHSRARVSTLVYNLGFKSIAENMKTFNGKLIMVVGNHDQKDVTRTPEHSLEPFKVIPGVHVLDEFVPFENRDDYIYPLSYSDDTEFIREKIAEYKEHCGEHDRGSILLGHLGVDGSETGRYSHRLEGAFQVGDLHPMLFDYVILGHYHKRQLLGGLPNIGYVGNTIQTSFSDEGQEKGVYYFTTIRMDEINFIPIQNKMFITLEDVDENTQEIVDNNYVRFILPKEKAQEVEMFKEESDNIRVEIQREYKIDTRIDIDVNSSEEQVVKAYAEEFYPDSVDVAVDILREALTQG